jgi:hypothetical protein
MDYNIFSMFPTNGRLKNVYTTKLQLCHAMDVSDKWGITPSTPKQTKVSQIPIKQSSKVVGEYFINIIKKLSNPLPLMTHCKFKSKSTLLQFSTT